MRAIEIKLSQGAKPGLGGLLPAAKVTPEIAAARGVPAGRRLREPARARGVSRRRRPARLRRDASPPRPACRSASSRRSGELDFWQRARRVACSATGARRGLRHHRRRRGRHRRGAAGVRRPRRAAVQDRARARVPRVRRGRDRRRVVFIGVRQARPAGERAARVRARLRHGQRRPRGDARRSAASRRSAATPVAARPGSPRTPRGCSAGSTRSAAPRGWRTTSPACAPSCCGWPAPAACPTRRWSRASGSSCWTEPGRSPRPSASAIAPAGGFPGRRTRIELERLMRALSEARPEEEEREVPTRRGQPPRVP